MIHLEIMQLFLGRFSVLVICLSRYSGLGLNLIFSNCLLCLWIKKKKISEILAEDGGK